MSRYSKYTKEVLGPVVRSCTSWPQVCGILGIPLSGSQTHIKNRAVSLGIDYSHFPGHAHNKGKVFGPKRPIEYYLTNRTSITSSSLRKRLIKEKLKEASCEECGLTEWRGEPADLELDHIDGNHFNNSLDNLKILCPNCHTFLTRKRKEAVRVDLRDKGKHSQSSHHRKPRKVRCRCGGYRTTYASCCRVCFDLGSRKFNPTREELATKVWEMPTTKVAEYYGVSDVSVSKRCKKLNIPKPPRGYWVKNGKID